MRRRVRRLAFILTAWLCLSLCGTALAGGPLPKGTGSLTVTMRDTDSGAAVPGGTLLLREVGKPAFDDGNKIWVFNEAFEDCGLSLADLGSAALAEGLAAYAKNNNIDGRTVEIGADGRASVEDLPVGLYLVTQVTPASGYSPIRPFLVSIPETVDGTYLYDVDASPKLELHKAPPTPTPTPPALPQTGQLWWPVPVLALIGLLLLGLGIWKRTDKR